MSSPKIRHLLNNLGARPGTRYFEIGLWRGSTFISTLFGNERTVTRAVGSDNWSQFGGRKSRRVFLESATRLLAPGSFSLVEGDCFQLDRSQLQPPFNLYFYDGGHLREQQRQAFTYFEPVLDSPAIVAVDDWDDFPARRGTLDAFKELGFTVVHEQRLPATEGWWNGFYVAVISKPSAPDAGR